MRHSRIEEMLTISKTIEWCLKRLDKPDEIKMALLIMSERMNDLIVSEQKLVEVLHDIMRID